MLISDKATGVEFTAGDGTKLVELFHPDKQKVSFRYSLAHASLEPGEVSKKHCLKTTEVYYILKGIGRMHVGEEISEVKEGQAIYVPPDAVQFIENTGKTTLEFLCIVDPAWKAEYEEVL